MARVRVKDRDMYSIRIMVTVMVRISVIVSLV
jgi:hypothetical protein